MRKKALHLRESTGEEKMILGGKKGSLMMKND